MKEIGSYEAKTHLPRILDEVERGQTVIITKHGRPVAKLSPVRPSPKSVEKIIEDMKRERIGRTAGVPFRTLIDEGRRY